VIQRLFITRPTKQGSILVWGTSIFLSLYLPVWTGLQGRTLRSAGMSQRALVYGQCDRSASKQSNTPVSRPPRRARNLCTYLQRTPRNSMIVRNKQTCLWASRTSKSAVEWVSLNYVQLAQSVSFRPMSPVFFSERSYQSWNDHEAIRIICKSTFLHWCLWNNIKVTDYTENYEW